MTSGLSQGQDWPDGSGGQEVRKIRQSCSSGLLEVQAKAMKPKPDKQKTGKRLGARGGANTRLGRRENEEKKK